jgi:cytochrome c-type biogenesis protein CcmH/NrfG
MDSLSAMHERHLVEYTDVEDRLSTSLALAPRSPARRPPASWRRVRGIGLSMLVLLATLATETTLQAQGEGLDRLRRQVSDHRYREAQAGLENWLETHPRDGEAWRLLGQVREGRWDYKNAADAYERAMDLLGENPDLLMRWVMTKGQTLNILSAIFSAAKLKDAVERVVELEPTNMEARGLLAAYYAVLPGIVGGSQEKSDRIVQELVQLDPAAGLTLQGYQAEQAGLPDSVKVNRWEAAIRHDPGFAGALYALGQHLVRQERFEEGLELYRRAMRAEPGDMRLRLSYGRALRRAGRADEAADEFRAILADDPYYADARFYLAEYYERIEDRQAAIREYQTLALHNPHYEEKEIRRRLRRLIR